jgi:hypothetical protein
MAKKKPQAAAKAKPKQATNAKAKPTPSAKAKPTPSAKPKAAYAAKAAIGAQPAPGKPLVVTGGGFESGIGIEAPPGIPFNLDSFVESIIDLATGTQFSVVAPNPPNNLSADGMILRVSFFLDAGAPALGDSGTLQISLMNIPPGGTPSPVDVAVDYIDVLP